MGICFKILKLRFPKHLNTDNLKKYSLNFILETNGWFENLLDLSENKSSSNKNFNRWCVRANRSNVINFQIESNILDKAIALGFFEIPRKISLEELANEMGKSKSALSVMLRKIIKKKVLFEK